MTGGYSLSCNSSRNRSLSVAAYTGRVACQVHVHVLPHLDEELAKSSSTVTGLSTPTRHGRHGRARGAGARRHRLPHPAFEDARADRGHRSVRRRASVGAVRRARAARSRGRSARSSSSRSSGTSIAHCGLPTRAPGGRNSRPAELSVPVPQARTRPMSMEQSSRASIRGLISPAAVRTENESCSVQPCLRRYITASRTPLPDSSASSRPGCRSRPRRRSRARPSRAATGCRRPRRCDGRRSNGIRRSQLERQLPFLDDGVSLPSACTSRSPRQLRLPAGAGAGGLLGRLRRRPCPAGLPPRSRRSQVAAGARSCGCGAASRPRRRAAAPPKPARCARCARHRRRVGAPDLLPAPASTIAAHPRVDAGVEPSRSIVTPARRVG